jgi:hypothetical protein
MKKIQILAIALLAISCNDEDAPQLINEEEVITTVEVSLTNLADPTNLVVLKSVDNDGDGPNEPVFTVTGTILANTNYLGATRFLDETESPVDDITLEVQGESLEHEVFYLTTVAGLTVIKTDTDTAGNPLGLRFDLATGAAGSGTITVILKHEPLKPNDNTPTGAGGETDVQVTFNVTVQ